MNFSRLLIATVLLGTLGAFQATSAAVNLSPLQKKRLSSQAVPVSHLKKMPTASGSSLETKKDAVKKVILKKNVKKQLPEVKKPPVKVLKKKIIQKSSSGSTQSPTK